MCVRGTKMKSPHVLLARVKLNFFICRSTTWIFGWVLLVIFLYLITNPTHAIRCSHVTGRGIYGANCSNMELEEIPTELDDGIGLLDLSWNLLQELKDDSFLPYKSVKFLYLQQNSIHTIEAGAFRPLSNLAVLDLSKNRLTKFDVYCPPSVYRLFLDDMTLDYINVSAITSLGHLSLNRGCLEKFPRLGVIPNLVELNLTGNYLNNVTVDDLASFCRLKTLRISTKNLFKKMFNNRTLCECLRSKQWIKTREIDVQSFSCGEDKNTNLTCDLEPAGTVVEKYNTCMAEYESRESFYRISIILVVIIIVTVIFISILLYVKRK